MPSLFRAFVELYIEKIALVFPSFYPLYVSHFSLNIHFAIIVIRFSNLTSEFIFGHRGRLLKMRYLPASGKYSAARSIFLFVASLNFGSLVQK